MEKLCVDKNMVIVLRYVMRNGNGDVLENTMQSAPVNYLHGSTGIPALLQIQLEGLKAGDRRRVYLFKESNKVDDDFEFDVIIDEVREALPEEIILGYPLQITTVTCDNDCNCYDDSKN
jgi:hypothetical protein